MTLRQKPASYSPPPLQLGHIYRQTEIHYPFETGGGLFLLENGEMEMIPLVNQAGDVAQSYRKTHLFEPNLTPFLKAFLKGSTLKLIFHSHPDGGDEMSHLDRETAQYNDRVSQLERPWYPDVSHLIVSVGRGPKALSSKLFMFSRENNRYESMAVFDHTGDPI
jgi:proteasome lid subunit RPN8/RPN11